MAAALTEWGGQQGRVFAWRDWRDPYRLLVAEILLRQTRAESVADFVPAFLDRYPDPAALAEAAEEDLVSTLKPLGFASQRAGQLRALGARVTEAGAVPLDMAGLLALPGVGRYTAAMVTAVASGTPAPAVDTNVARVICRVFAITPSHAEARKSTNIWDVAAEMAEAVPDAARLTWAMVDLAALICRQRSPRCTECPLIEMCDYGQSRRRRAHDRDEKSPAAERAAGL